MPADIAPTDVGAATPPPNARPLPPGRFAEFWASFSENRGAVAGMVVLAVIIVLAVFADVVAPHSPIEQFRAFTCDNPIRMFTAANPDFFAGTRVDPSIVSR